MSNNELCSEAQISAPGSNMSIPQFEATEVNGQTECEQESKVSLNREDSNDGDGVLYSEDDHFSGDVRRRDLRLTRDCLRFCEAAAADPEPPVITSAPLEEVYGAKKKEPTKPPHHLLETQIFPTLHKNEIIQVQPQQLSFIVQHGHQTKKLRVINTSSTRQNFHLIEPLNHKIWSVTYKKPDGGLVPGGSIDIAVKFTLPAFPQAATIYQDSIRLHCTGGNLLIPVYAYPTINTKSFPDKINFGSIPLGQESTRIIKLSSPENESFDYSCTMHPPSAFHVTPSFGTICGETEISVTYQPTEFITSSTNMQIVFSTFDRKILKCKISGNCLPGLLTLKKKKEFELKRKNIRPSEKRTTKETSDQLASLAREESAKARKKLNAKSQPNHVQRIEPGAQHHVNKILNSKDKNGKKKDSHDQIYIDRSNVFRDKLKKALEAEKINKLRWQIRLGDEVPTFDELETVRQSRNNQDSTTIGDRTEREANSIPSCTPNFDPYRNSPWRARHVALGQFQQAARTILIRIRGEDRLAKLRKLMKLVNGDGLSIEAAETTLLEQMGRQIKLKVKGVLSTITDMKLDDDSPVRKRMTVNLRPDLSNLTPQNSYPTRQSVLHEDRAHEDGAKKIETYNDILQNLHPDQRLTQSIAQIANHKPFEEEDNQIDEEQEDKTEP